MLSDDRLFSSTRKVAALVCVLVSFSAKAAWGRIKGPKQARMIDSSGKKLLSVFEGLPRSPRVSSYRYLTAAARACTPGPTQSGPEAPKASGSPTFTPAVLTDEGRSARYVPAQASSCGGHYGTSYEEPCGSGCVWQVVYAGGDRYCVGWTTHNWGACCGTQYQDLICCDPPGCFENNCFS